MALGTPWGQQGNVIQWWDDQGEAAQTPQLVIPGLEATTLGLADAGGGPLVHWGSPLVPAVV